MTIEAQYRELKSYYHWPFGVNMPVWFACLERKMEPGEWDWTGRKEMLNTFFFARD